MGYLIYFFITDISIHNSYQSGDTLYQEDKLKYINSADVVSDTQSEKSLPHAGMYA